jgi:dipeptidyl aminopeptidase/acylaminoacyl peptidase
MQRIITLSCALLLLPLAAAAQQRGVLPQDYYRMTFIGDVEVAPDGGFVAFTVTTVDEQENRRRRAVWLQPLRGGQPAGEAFRFTEPTNDASAPRWSPDGALLSFTSRRGRDPNTTWFARVRGPGGEAFRIEGVAGPPVWSPDGRWIAFVRSGDDDDEADERGGERGGRGAERRGWIAPDAVTTTLDARRFDGRVVTSMRYKRDGTLGFLGHHATRPRAQLHVVPAGGGEARRVTDLAFDVRGPLWTPDGRTLVFTADPHQYDEHSDQPTAALWAVSRDGGEPRRLGALAGGHAAPALSPDGRRLAFLHTPERGAQTDLLMVEIAADGTFRGEPRNLTTAWDLVPGAPAWTPDGRTLRFEAAIGGAVHLFEVPADGGASRQITAGERQLRSFSASRDGRVIAYTAGDAATPAELYLAGRNGAGERRATGFNDGWLAEVAVVRPERLTWRVEDGTEIEGWLVRPVDYDPGHRYPMVLKIHGGPHSAYGHVFFQAFHVLSGAGFFVLYPNPRGSSGYGHSFMYATRGRWGELDSEDFLLGVETALNRYPQIDPARVGVAGGSYGGFMTNWLTATTDRFAAAVTSRSITNWESWYGTSDAQGLTEYEFFGPPWEQRELYRRLSPISHVEHVTAPTLIIHSENDYRTPIADGEQWFMALMKRGVPAELVRYPRSSHGLSRTGEPWLLVDRLERLRSWFVYWLRTRHHSPLSADSDREMS